MTVRHILSLACATLVVWRGSTRQLGTRSRSNRQSDSTDPDDDGNLCAEKDMACEMSHQGIGGCCAGLNCIFENQFDNASGMCQSDFPWECQPENRIFLTEVDRDSDDYIMRFHNVFSENTDISDSVNLEVVNVNGYTVGPSDKTGLWGRFGNINIRCGTTATLRFKFKWANNNVPYAPAHGFFFTWFDLDQDRYGGCKESVSVPDARHWFRHPNSSVIQDTDEDGVQTFSSQDWGQEDTNPSSDPMKLTEDQKRRLVIFQMPAVSEFVVNIGATKEGKEGRVNGRNMEFAGGNSLVCESHSDLLIEESVRSVEALEES